jgi:hypothetical protein
MSSLEEQRGAAPACWSHDNQRGAFLGAGVYGSVFRSCDGAGNCPYVTKVVDAKERPTADREIYFLRLLADSSVVPKLVRHWVCEVDKASYLTLERFDGDITDLVRNNVAEHVPSRWGDTVACVLTAFQLNRIYEIAVELSNRRVLHGDLKLDNFLYRVADRRLVVSDFGLSGFLYPRFGDVAPKQGFTSAAHSCADISTHFREYFNVWQLEAHLVSIGTVIVAPGGTKALFTGFGDVALPWHVRNHLSLRCDRDNAKEDIPTRYGAGLAELRRVTGLPAYQFHPSRVVEPLSKPLEHYEKKHIDYFGEKDALTTQAWTSVASYTANLQTTKQLIAQTAAILDTLFDHGPIAALLSDREMLVVRDRCANPKAYAPLFRWPALMAQRSHMYTSFLRALPYALCLALIEHVQPQLTFDALLAMLRRVYEGRRVGDQQVELPSDAVLRRVYHVVRNVMVWTTMQIPLPEDEQM